MAVGIGSAISVGELLSGSVVSNGLAEGVHQDAMGSGCIKRKPMSQPCKEGGHRFWIESLHV